MFRCHDMVFLEIGIRKTNGLLPNKEWFCCFQGSQNFAKNVYIDSSVKIAKHRLFRYGFVWKNRYLEIHRPDPDMASADDRCPSPSSDSAQLDGKMGGAISFDMVWGKFYRNPQYLIGKTAETLRFPVSIFPSTNPATIFFRGNVSLRNVHFKSGCLLCSPENILCLIDKHVFLYTHWNKLG